VARCFPEIEMEVITPPRWREAEVEVNVERDEFFPVRAARTFLSKHIQLFMYDPRPIIAALREHKPHIIDMNHEPYSLPCAEVITLRNLYAPDAHIVMQTAQNIPKAYPLPFSLLEKRAFGQVSAAYMCSETVREVLEAKGFDRPMRIVPFGVDLDMFEPVERARQDVFTVGFVGRLLPAKGVSVLVEALAGIRDAQWRLLIVGDGPERAAIERRIAELGIADRCEITGAVPYDDTPTYFNKLDALVVPTITTARIREQFGRVIVEAMACKVPVIGSTCGAIPEVIGEAGIVVPENDPEILSNRLQQLMRDRDLCEGLGEEGRRRVEEHYTWDRVAEGIYETYREALTGPVRGRVAGK
jgi:glycosyltransferase involved in cell wall biosynthesis